MQTYYIPSSTLNFTNILSTESISPAAFYTMRGFGIKRWTKVDHNNLDEVILLYEKPFFFSRPQNGQEDHPLFVEVTLPEVLPIVRGGYCTRPCTKICPIPPRTNKMYYCDHTIYLSPWNTRFFFLSRANMDTMKILAGQSAETKFLKLYEKRLHVLKRDELQQMNIPSVLQDSPFPLNRDCIEIEEDWKKDKLKGLLYGYYIGAKLSMDKNSLNVSNHLEKLYARIFSILASHRVQLEEEEKYAIDLEVELMRKGLSNALLLSPDEESVVLSNQSVSKIDEKGIKKLETELILCIFNEILLKRDIYSGNFTRDMQNIFKTLPRIIGNTYSGEAFEELKLHITEIYNYFCGQAYESWGDNIYSSIAAFIKKGDDWNKLYNIVKNKGITDCKFVFALYGEYVGAANLTRDFTDNILSIDDKKYIIRIIKEFNGQLLGDDLVCDSKFLPEVPIEVITDHTKTPISNGDGTNNNVEATPIELPQAEWKTEFMNCVDEIKLKRLEES